MASKIIGRTVCPLRCGHDAAHVKIKTDKEEGKTAYPYAYCPGCGCMQHTKNEGQARALAALTRLDKIDQPAPEIPAPTPTGKIVPVVVQKPTPTPSPKPSGLFGLFGGAHG